MNKRWWIIVAAIVVGLVTIIIGLWKCGHISKENMILYLIFSIGVPALFLVLQWIKESSNKKNTTTPEEIANKTVEKLIEKGILPPADIEKATAQEAIEEDIQRDPNPSERKQKAEEEFRKGNIDKALQMLDSDALANDTEQTAGEYRFKAWMLKLKQDYAEAERHYRRAVEIYPSFSNTFALAKYLQDQNRHQEAEMYYTECLKNASDDNERVGTLHNLANLHNDTNQPQKAEAEYSEALGIGRRLAAENPSVFDLYIATTLHNLANLHWNMNQRPKAEKEYREALDIYQRLATDNPAAYERNVAGTLYNLAVLHYNTNQYPKTEEEYNEALEIYRRLSADNPAAYEEYVARTLNNLGALHGKTKQYSEAEKEWNEALVIYTRLAKLSPEAFQSDVELVQRNLKILNDLQKQ
ncbi:MAG: tetratricopeptide repeat protein [Rikenellaceae bacterium]|jgi:tetratricopeptide (TPR) repeat protein|nr:tetratricopeptide repeat protein [Rikenellaceae bacterium]